LDSFFVLKEYLILILDEPSRKRKFDQIESTERKKSSGIWSLALMAEKNENKSNSQRSSSSSSCSSNQG
jgi:hypothetical protein